MARGGVGHDSVACAGECGGVWVSICGRSSGAIGTAAWSATCWLTTAARAGRPQAEVPVQLGREDGLDVAGLRRLVGSISRYVDGGRGRAVAPETGGGLTVEAARPIEASWVPEGCGSGLASRRHCGRPWARRQFTVGMERVLLALVASRAIAPSSKLAAAEWASQDVVIPGLDRMGKGLYATKHGERLHSLAVR
jgi:hypothetical protein